MGQYHEDLGVSTNASDADIKAAYRKLSGKHHPDKAHAHGWDDDETSKNEDQYKKVNEAYRNLKKGVHDPVQNSSGWNHRPNAGFPDMEGINAAINQMMIQQHIKQMARSNISQVDYQNGRWVQGVGIPIKTILAGGDYVLDTVYPIMNGTNISMTRHTETIKLTKNTLVGSHHECAGVPITVVYIPMFDATDKMQLDGFDIIAEFKVGTIDALLGRSVEFTHVDGSKLKITIPQGVTGGKMIRIPKRGLSHIMGTVGDLYLSVVLESPTLSTSQIKYLNKAFKKLKL